MRMWYRFSFHSLCTTLKVTSIGLHFHLVSRLKEWFYFVLHNFSSICLIFFRWNLMPCDDKRTALSIFFVFIRLLNALIVSSLNFFPWSNCSYRTFDLCPCINLFFENRSIIFLQPLHDYRLFNPLFCHFVSRILFYSLFLSALISAPLAQCWKKSKSSFSCNGRPVFSL